MADSPITRTFSRTATPFSSTRRNMTTSSSSSGAALVDVLAQYRNGQVTFCRPRDENDNGQSHFVEPGPNGTEWMQANPFSVLLTGSTGGFTSAQVRLTVFSESPLPTVTARSGTTDWTAGSPRNGNRELPFLSPVFQATGNRITFSLVVHVGGTAYNLNATLDTSGRPPTNDDDIIVIDPSPPDPDPIL